MLDEEMEIYIGKNGIIKLTSNETWLLTLLLSKKSKSATYKEINEHMWGNLLPMNRVRANIQVTIMKLNKKLKGEFQINSVRGIGLAIR